MMISERIIKMPSRADLVFWAASVGKNKVCELTRVSGFIIEKDNEHITFFLPKQLFSIIEPTLEINSKVSFLMASIQNFESYQIKGEYISHQLCTEENIDFYRLKVLKIADILSGMGLDGNGVFGYLLEQPSIAVTMRCTEMFEQTPKPGTGGKLTD